MWSVYGPKDSPTQCPFNSFPPEYCRIPYFMKKFSKILNFEPKKTAERGVSQMCSEF